MKMDSALREILKEEKRKREEKHKTDKHREDKHKDDKHRSERREKRDEKKEDKKDEIKEIQNKEIKEKEDDNIQRFMFIYEDQDGTLYSKLESIPPAQIKVKIFPVYVSGYNENLAEEEITYVNGTYQPSEDNQDSTWLSIIRSNDAEILVVTFEGKDIVVYNGKFFHCLNDLLDYLSIHDAEYLSVTQ